jgi:hypothetical protein
MMSGKDIATMMATSASLAMLPSQPAARDVDQQWLQTAGIVSTVADASPGGLSTQTFAWSGDPNCHDATQEGNPAAGGTVVYCINGIPLLSDHGYWIATSDHLAKDSAVYTTMSSEPPRYAAADVSAKIGIALALALKPIPDQGKTSIAQQESLNQQRTLFQLDFGKLVAGYTIQEPSGGDANISTNFQGVTDTTASSASSKSVDIEATVRLTHDFENPLKIIPIPKRFILGVQSDLEWTGKRTGNLNLTSGPPSWSYSANSFTIGPFLQHALAFRFLKLGRAGIFYPYDPAQRSLPTLSLVIAPFQYQTQVSSVVATISGVSGSATTQPPLPWAFSHRVGLRYAWDGGKWYLPDSTSYAEFGLQYNKQRNVISSIVLDGVNCPSSAVTYTQCATTNNLTLSSTTQVSVDVAKQTTWGGYWDIALQKGIGKMYDKSGPEVKLIFDSKGDLFNNGASTKSYSSQTRFSVPLNLAVTFPFWRNLSVAPTYQAYLYQNQIAGKFLVVHNASISLRWYFDRDASVPWFWKSFVLVGPSSANTSQASSK